MSRSPICDDGNRDLYLRTLQTYVVDLGGGLEETPGTELVATFGARRITLRLR